KKPQDRAEALRPAIEALGGKLVSFYMSFGEYDAVVIADMPDNISAAAVSIAAAAGGAVKAIKTTPLMTVREGMEA
ncbi:MAG: GYD domain-containing protein, partial [Anaerolineae bacterium]|nr:GYD domain-containing protein [Anaerolineae bacterium]